MENGELREEIEELEICESFDMQEPCRSERSTKGKGNRELPDNYMLAKGRLTSLIRRLRHDPDMLKRYDDVIQDQLTKGIIEEAPPVQSSHRLHYLPHHHVISPSSTTTKLRIVYDGSAKTTKSNNSLNECLFRGPVLLQDLAGILL